MPSIITSLFQASSLINAGKSLFRYKGYTKVGELVIDAVLNEDITYSAQATEHPVEDGRYITDHVIKKPMTVEIRGYITDSPIRFFGIIETPVQKNTIDSLVKNAKSLLPFSNQTTPSQDAYKVLKATEGTVISVVTKLDAFNDMFVKSVRFSNSVENRGRLDFTLELMKINYAQVKTVKNTSQSLGKRVSSVQDAGVVQNKPAKSYAASITDSVKDWLKK